MLWQIITASLIVSLVSLVSILVILSGKTITKRRMKALVGLASGILLSVVFLELLPEIFTETEVTPEKFFPLMLAAILFFYLLERLMHWHHCHDKKCPPETRIHVAYTNLIGDGVHNFIDGILISASFLVSPNLGIATTLAVVAHEVPQEISDTSVLLFAGLSKAKVILFNFLFSLTALIGALLAFLFSAQITTLLPVLVAIAAGNFTYLALSDLIPELHLETETRYSWYLSLWLFAGVLLFWLISQLTGA